MRWRKRSCLRFAAWLGVIALGLNALVPIHFAFDLAEALRPAQHASGADLDRQILGLLTGHEADSDHHHHQHDRPGGHHSCPVCAAAATLAALALPNPAALPLPATAAVRLDPAPIVVAGPAIFPAAYRARAPPLG